MGAMKNIAIDVMDLQEAAFRADEEEFLMHVTNSGWISPTEQEGRAFQASKLLKDLPEDQRTALAKVLDAMGISLPAIDFQFKALSNAAS